MNNPDLTKVNWLTRDEFIKLILEVDREQSEMINNPNLKIGYLVERYYSNVSSDTEIGFTSYIELDYKDIMNSEIVDIKLHSVKRIAILNYE